MWPLIVQCVCVSNVRPQECRGMKHITVYGREFKINVSNMWSRQDSAAVSVTCSTAERSTKCSVWKPNSRLDTLFSPKTSICLTSAVKLPLTKTRLFVMQWEFPTSGCSGQSPAPSGGLRVLHAWLIFYPFTGLLQWYVFRPLKCILG